MFRPLSLFIGLRYTRAKRRNQLISFISLASIIGIAIGVTVLITVLSVMNGFDHQIKNRIFQLAPQVSIRSVNGGIKDWRELEYKARKFSNVTATAPFISGQGMLTSEGIVHATLIYGINPKLEKNVSKIGSKMVVGKLSSLQPNKFGIVLGQDLAASLGLNVGNKVTVVTPQATVSIVGILPRFKQFTVVGIFNAGNGFGFDSQLAYINLQDAQKLFELGQKVTGVRLKIKDLYNAPMLAMQLAKKLTNNFYVSNWTQTYGPLFKAIRLEKNMMFLILILIIAVAAFNLVATLVMVVNEKRADIAILRTFGATPRMIMTIFIVQGFVVGLFGTLLGLIGGIALSMNVTAIAAFIERVFHVQLLSSSVYYVNYLPSKIEPTDVLHVCIAAFILSLLATLYPAWRAARTQPAEALRYE